MRLTIISLFVGVAFGFALSRIGFSSWEEVHKMFTFADLRLLLGFATAVVLLAGSWRILSGTIGTKWTPRLIHRGTVAGGVLFGAGWALSGACPSIALVQLGEGQLGALWTLAGIFAGNWIYSMVHERWFRWSTGSCLDE